MVGEESQIQSAVLDGILNIRRRSYPTLTAWNQEVSNKLQSQSECNAHVS